MQQTVEAIRDWFRQCPAISKENRFGVDSLSTNPTEYAIYMSPSSLQTGVDITGEGEVKVAGAHLGGDAVGEDLSFAFTDVGQLEPVLVDVYRIFHGVVLGAVGAAQLDQPDAL